MRKKILLQSDYALSKTGFGRCMKSLLTYLFKTGKYDLVHYCCGMNLSHPALQKTPWKSVGCLPDNQAELDALNRDPNQATKAGYGAHYLDKTIQEEKPDVYIAVQDFWGVDFAIDKKWFNKIPSVVWTTLDSLPILPVAVEKASKLKNYWVWSNFAEKALHQLGHKQVKTIHGPIEDRYFFKLPLKKKQELRARFEIAPETFVIGFVFRNQLRKSVPNLLEGFKMFRTNNPTTKAKLLLHTCFTEGWKIPKLAKEYGVDNNDILTTYICHACNNFQVKAYSGEGQNCPFCKTEKSQHTTNVGRGVSEEQLNEIYNLMDVYCHPFTSGGQEVPVQEAKLTELITLVTNYSCGEELCEPGSGSFALEWDEYREHGTEFRKANTYPASIAKQLGKVLEMPPQKRAELGKQAREWTLKNFSIATVGKQVESFLDSCEPTKFDFSDQEPQKNPNAQVEDIQDSAKWLIGLYRDILKNDLDETDSGHQYWMQQIKGGMPRQQIVDYFRQVAFKHNQEQTRVEFKDQFNKEDKKRVLVVLPESIGDVYLATSLLESIRDRYPRPDWGLYFATKPEYFEVLDGNPFIDKVLPYSQEFDNLLFLEGMGNHEGFVDIAYLLHVPTQRFLTYVHRGCDSLDIKCTS
jgi:glycosyltransferase involved in cell wall biosynthesis